MEVLKLLAAGIIYPIADSKWVSPVHCFPKKGGMTVVPNDKNELIPHRTIIGESTIYRLEGGEWEIFNFTSGFSFLQG